MTNLIGILRWTYAVDPNRLDVDHVAIQLHHMFGLYWGFYPSRTRRVLVVTDQRERLIRMLIGQGTPRRFNLLSIVTADAADIVLWSGTDF